jgi:cytochrome b
MPGARTTKVWDPLVRIGHWTLAAAALLAWLSTEGWRPEWHKPAGYVAAAVVVLRIVWGFTGRRFARFDQFVRGPRATAAYAWQVARRRERRHLGHNPLGGWMAVVLMATLLALALTGWLYTTDRFWGAAWVETLHRRLAWSLVGLVALHVAGVVYTSWRQRENLVRSMLDGMKRGARGDDIA